MSTSLPPADVEQTDIHMPRTTVHEALQISGLLRLHNTSRAVVEQFVNEVSAGAGSLSQTDSPLTE